MSLSLSIAARRTLLVASIAMLAACSATRLAYENSDLWLTFKTNSYLDLNDEQSGRTRVLAAQALERHRREELPNWMSGARDLASAIDDGLSRSEVTCVQRELLGLFNNSVAILAEYTSGVLVDLDDAQIAALAKAVADDDRRFRERYLQTDPMERIDERVERVTGWIEYWTGDLLGAQQVWLNRAIRNYPSMSDLWADYHTQQRQQLLLKVDNKVSPEEMRAFLESWWSGTADQSAPFLAAVDRSRAALREFAVDLDGILTSYQRDRVQSRLRGIADDLESLLSDGTAIPPGPSCAGNVVQVGL